MKSEREVSQPCRATASPASAISRTTQTPPAPVTKEQIDSFLEQHGDAIDDWVAELVEQLIAEQMARYRLRRRMPTAIAVLLGAVTVATVLLRAQALAVMVVWVAAAVICGFLTHLYDVHPSWRRRS